MKKQVRILAAVICLILCLASVSCAAGDDDGNGTTAAADTQSPDDPSTSEITSASDVDAQGYQLDCLPGSLNYGNAEITFLYWADVERPEFFVDALSGDVVNDAIYERNIAVEERLGVKLKYIPTDGDVGESANFLKVVQSSFNAGEKIYDILASHSRTGAVVAAGGMTADILAVEDSYLDLSKPWWPSTMVDTATIGNSMYFISGDISTNTLHFMYGIYCNMDLINNYGLENPTQLALEGSWTLDKLIGMTSNMYSDLNSNNTHDYGDFFGLTTLYYHADSFYSGCGMKWIDKSEETKLCVSADYTSEKAINLSEKLASWFAVGDCYTNNDSYTHKTFAEGNALFAQNRIYIADNSHASGLNSATFKYSVVPNPKYDENQERYYTTVGNPFTLYEIMISCDKSSMATAVLECLGSEGYRRTTPAIFEINMKHKYAADEETSQSFDIIRSSIVFDLGRIFGAKTSTMSEIYSKACINNQNWASTSKSQAKIISKLVSKLVESFD